MVIKGTINRLLSFDTHGPIENELSGDAYRKKSVLTNILEIIRGETDSIVIS
jgi:hypothetical protein